MFDQTPPDCSTSAISDLDARGTVRHTIARYALKPVTYTLCARVWELSSQCEQEQVSSQASTFLHFRRHIQFYPSPIIPNYHFLIASPDVPLAEINQYPSTPVSCAYQVPQYGPSSSNFDVVVTITTL